MFTPKDTLCGYPVFSHTYTQGALLTHLAVNIK